MIGDEAGLMQRIIEDEIEEDSTYAESIEEYERLMYDSLGG